MRSWSRVNFFNVFFTPLIVLGHGPWLTRPSCDEELLQGLVEVHGCAKDGVLKDRKLVAQ